MCACTLDGPRTLWQDCNVTCEEETNRAAADGGLVVRKTRLNNQKKKGRESVCVHACHWLDGENQEEEEKERTSIRMCALSFHAANSSSWMYSCADLGYS